MGRLIWSLGITKRRDDEMIRQCFKFLESGWSRSDGES